MWPTGLEMIHTMGKFSLHRAGPVITLPETGFDDWMREAEADGVKLFATLFGQNT
jgi:hypothetical protein